jgi:SAM-dependent methyltransferase
MRAEATRRVAAAPRPALGAGGRVAVVAGTAEHLPLASGAMDVAWLSAVVHHLVDLDAAAAEVRRVLRPGGRVLVRGLFSDRGRVSWLDPFPGAERALARFPSTERVVRALAAAGLALVDVVELDATGPATGAAAAAWVRSARHADTLLTALSDAEVDAGVGNLLAEPDAELAPTVLALVTCTALGGDRRLTCTASPAG